MCHSSMKIVDTKQIFMFRLAAATTNYHIQIVRPTTAIPSFSRFFIVKIKNRIYNQQYIVIGKTGTLLIDFLQLAGGAVVNHLQIRYITEIVVETSIAGFVPEVVHLVEKSIQLRLISFFTSPMLHSGLIDSHKYPVFNGVQRLLNQIFLQCLCLHPREERQ